MRGNLGLVLHGGTTQVERNVGGRRDMRSLAPTVGMVSNVASRQSLWRRQHLLGRIGVAPLLRGTCGAAARRWHPVKRSAWQELNSEEQ
jgi:hypothetical protein